MGSAENCFPKILYSSNANSIQVPLENKFSFLVLLALVISSVLKDNKKVYINHLHTKNDYIETKLCSTSGHQKIPNISASHLTYFHPTIDPHPMQNMSLTVCIPVIIIRSSLSPTVTFTLSNIREVQCHLKHSFKSIAQLLLFPIAKTSSPGEF